MLFRSMPSIRTCQTLFGVSKTTVEHAYLKLCDEGYICSKPQSGYYVDVDHKHLTMRRYLLQQHHIKENPIVYDFRSQSFDETVFDMKIWKKYLKDVMDDHDHIITYGDPQGELSLRKSLQRYAYNMRGVMSQVENIIVGASFQTLLYILCGLFPKDSVIGVEKGSLNHARQVFLDYHFQVVDLKKGFCIDELNAKGIQFLYVYTGSYGNNHQPMSVKKKMELLEWARQSQTYIIEDDHNGEVRYVSDVSYAMQSKEEDLVIYMGSFSRLVLPSFRMSYVVLPSTLASLFHERLDCYSPTSSQIEQLAFARYITDGHLQRHTKKLTKLYRLKNKQMEHLLYQYFPEAKFTLEEANLQYTLDFGESYDLYQTKKDLREQGIYIHVLSSSQMVLSFAAIALDEMENAMMKVSQILGENKK